jgi:predicted enzyme related to lactoylglutathione lyase
MEVMLAWFKVPDLAKAKDFYGNVLGLKKTFEMGGWAEFSHADGAAAIGLMQDASPATDGGAVVALKVPDLDRTRGDLTRKGVQLEGAVEEFSGMVRLQMFRDPFGNRLQLVEVMMQPQTAS